MSVKKLQARYQGSSTIDLGTNKDLKYGGTLPHLSFVLDSNCVLN